MAEEPKQTINPRLVLALGHPVRAGILELLINEKELSPNSLAARLGIKEGSVGYHLTVLRQCEAIEVARTEQRQGAPERFFRPVPGALAGDGSWAQIPAAVKSDISAAVMRDFISREADFEPRGREKSARRYEGRGA